MNESYLLETLKVFAHRAQIAAIGGSFVLIGAFFGGYLPWSLRKMLVFRDVYAADLRANGENEKAREIEERTACYRLRLPLYGRVLATVGGLAIAASLFLPQ